MTMCRLLGFVSPAQMTFTEKTGPDFGEFLKLARVHKDGWGLALSSSNHAKVYKDVNLALESNQFMELIETEKGSGGLLHFRWATPGIQISRENAHPFSHDEISFIHNGAILDYEELEKKIPQELLSKRTGNGDSEIYFLYSISQIQEFGPVNGIKAAVQEIKDRHKYSSINAFFLTPDYFVAVCENHPDNRPSWATDEYYELRYHLDDTGFLISSSGWNQTGWNEVPNHSMLILNRATLQVEIFPV